MVLHPPPSPYGHPAPRWLLPSIAAAALALVAVGAPGASVDANPSSPFDPAEPPTGELWVQNMTQTDPLTSVTARFFDASRSRDFPSVLLPPSPRSDDVLRIGSVAAQLPDGQYAAMVGPNKPFPSAAVARNEWPASGAAVIYPASEADTRVVVPWVARRHGDARASSRVRIQNARPDRSAVVTVRITAMGAASPTVSLTRSIPAGYATELDLAQDADLSALPDGFAGSLSAQVNAGYAIAAVATTELEAEDQAAYAVAGQRTGTLGNRLVAPIVTHRRTMNRRDGESATLDSFIAVMNGGNATTPVTITYQGVDVPGNACAGQTLVHGGTPVQIPPQSAVVFAQGTLLAGLAIGSSGLPEDCEATAVIRSGGAPLAATVVEIEDGGRRAGAYEAQPAAVAQPTAYLPLFRRGFDNLSSSFHVANAGEQTTTARVRMVLFGDNRTITVERSATLAPGAAASWDASSLAEIPDGAIGAAAITGSSPGVPLVAVARETADDGKKDNALYASAIEPAKIDHPAPIPDEYQPYFAPSVWKSGVYDLGLMATGTTAAEIQRVKLALNAQAFAYARLTGQTIAVSVQPYMIGKVPFHDWLRAQIDSGFPEVDVKARTWLVGLNYNAVTLLGRSDHLEPVDAGVFPGQGDFLDEAWSLNLVTGSPQPSAVPWLRVGCSPNYRNLALVATSEDRDAGFRLMQYLVRPEQQRENYQPQSPGRGQIGHPTLKALYTEFGINCPAAPAIVRTAPERVEDIIGLAVADADRLASAFDALDVDLYGDGANAAKATGVESSRTLVVTQPMVNSLAADELDRRLRSPAGLVVGTLSLRRLPTPTPSDTPTPTPTSTPTPTPTNSPTPTPTSTPTPTDPPTPTPTNTPTLVPTLAATSTPTPLSTVAATPTPTPTRTRTATPGATATGSSTPTPTPTASAEVPRPILLPYAARGHELGTVPGAGRLLRLDGSLLRQLKPIDRQPLRPMGQRQAPNEAAAYAIVWRKQEDGSIRTEIMPEGGGAAVDPGSLGISVPPVAPRFQGGQEPEAWVERGSIIVCINVDQYKGCMSVAD